MATWADLPVEPVSDSRFSSSPALLTLPASTTLPYPGRRRCGAAQVQQSALVDHALSRVISGHYHASLWSCQLPSPHDKKSRSTVNSPIFACSSVDDRFVVGLAVVGTVGEHTSFRPILGSALPAGNPARMQLMLGRDLLDRSVSAQRLHRHRAVYSGVNRRLFVAMLSALPRGQDSTLSTCPVFGTPHAGREWSHRAPPAAGSSRPRTAPADRPALAASSR